MSLLQSFLDKNKENDLYLTAKYHPKLNISYLKNIIDDCLE